MPNIPSRAELASRYISEQAEFFGKRLDIHNQKGGSQLWYRAIVDGGAGVGPVSIAQVGIQGGEFIRLYGTNEDKDTVEILLHVSQIRVSFITVPLNNPSQKQPIGFNAQPDPIP